MEAVPERSPRVALDPALRAPAWAARLPAWAWTLLFAAGFWLVRAAGYFLVDRPGGLGVVWPATGLSLYALFVTRRGRWLVVLGVVFGVGVLDALRFGRSASEAVAYNAAQVANSVAAWWLVVRLGGRPTLRTLRGALVLMGAPAVALAVVSALAYTTVSPGGSPLVDPRFWIFWAGSSLGIVLVTSLLVEWTEPAGAPAGPGAGLSVAGIILVFGAGLVLLRIPGLPVDDVVLLPPLLWAAVRFGARGATVALALGAAAFLLAGPWTGGAAGAAAIASGTVATQVFLGIGAASILAVAAVGEERRVAEWRRVLLERAIDRSPDPAGVLDEGGSVLWANEAAARQLGVPRSAMAGRRVWELAGARREVWRDRWARTVAQGALVTRESLPGPDGRAVPFEMSAAVVDVGGQRLMVSVLRDLTDRRRAEESSRLVAIGTLAAGVAHEINNPLTYVVSNLAHVKERIEALPGPPRAELLEPLTDAEDGARRVRDIVRQLRVFARVDEAAGPVDPGRALRAALAMAQNEIRHRARLATDLSPTPAVNASENRLTQVFVNLLVNAAQAIPEGNAERNEVRAALFPRDGEVVAEISDTGGGMSAATRARIFEPFFTTKTQGEGTGLGLAISHSIVTGLGGRIEVESTPGSGSRFRVVLPAAREAGGPSGAPVR